MRLLYNTAIFLYYSFIWLISPFNRKARLWIDGRKGLMEKIALAIDEDADYIWFHCASLGEFEQGRPVIEKFKEMNRGFRVILTFFSPSGYENKKKYSGADLIFYMPIDTKRMAEKFLEYVKPKAAVFVKYEFWYNHLNVLHRKKIPVIFISAIFRQKQVFFRFFGKWFRNHLKKVTYFFVQNTESQALLHSVGINNVAVSGDTRFDRVYDISQNPESFQFVEKFIQGSVIFISGSIWPKDEKLIVPLMNRRHKGLKYIIVPHEINEAHINKFKESIDLKVVRYSEQSEHAFQNADVLIIDTIGMLSHLYQYASIAYIGGGFGKGIHNILEAAVFGMPVIFGPNYTKFDEAKELIKYGGAFSVKDNKEFYQIITTILGDYKLLKAVSETSKNYVLMKKGATEKIILFLNTMLNPRGIKPVIIKDINMN